MRLPRAFSAGFVLPTAAAAALVVTATGATGATVAASSPAPAIAHEMIGAEAETAKAEEAAEALSEGDLASRRQAAAVQSAVVQGRTEEKLRAARSAARKAAAKAAARAKAERESKRWVKAVNSGQLTSDFGWRWGKTHDGLDIGATSGTPIYAMSKGRVVRSFFDSSFGNKVEIQYWDGTVSWYAHMSTRLVQPGDTVMPGDMVGRVGNTGYSFGAHLHIEIHPGPGLDQPMNPAPWLRNKGILIG